MRNWKNKFNSFKSFLNHQRWLVLFFLGWVWYFIQFWSRALFTNPSGGLSLGHINMWGDWAAHFTMATQIASRSDWLVSGPFLWGQPLRYPFVVNWLSAQILKVSDSLWLAFVLPSLVLSLILVGGVWWLYKNWFKSTSTASLALFIFLMNGGIGFVYFLRDAASKFQANQPWWQVTHEYTRLDDAAIKWISVIDSMIIPQRAFVLGFPLAVLALAIVYRYLVNPLPLVKKWRKIDWLVVGSAGMIFGLLPILHTHSFLACFVIGCSWFIGATVEQWQHGTKSGLEWGVWIKRWLAVIVPSALLATWLVATFFASHVSHNFSYWVPGWLAHDYQQNWFWWWFKNWTIVPVLALAGWIYLWFSRRLTTRNLTWWLFLPFFVLFILLNLIIFQPFAWDNTKLLVWVSLGFSGLAAVLIRWLSSKQRWLGVFVFIFITASGVIDAYWIQRTELHSYQMYSAEELSLVKWVKANTPADSLWLTGDQHNHWLFNLTGRQSLISYRGWLWTHGYDYHLQEKVVKALFSDPEHNQSLFSDYDIDYVVIGPNELIVWEANQDWFENHFTLVNQSENYAIFSTKL